MKKCLKQTDMVSNEPGNVRHYINKMSQNSELSNYIRTVNIITENEK